MSAATDPALDDWGSETLRRAPVRPIPGPLEFLWALADLMADEPLYVGLIARRLNLKNCKERVSTTGGLYATLKTLCNKGLMTYESLTPNVQGKYRITAAGLAYTERSPESLRDRAYWRMEERQREIERSLAGCRRRIAMLETELAEVAEKMDRL